MEYSNFREEALRFCKENRIDYLNVTSDNKEKLHNHMRIFVVAKCTDAKHIKAAMIKCNDFEKSFWKEVTV